ncbi:hypothetical protein V6N11_077688 [Hibiscus sabdariffa]|uniref:Uncharacterized protein n=1 Tax=Hibiscus sabdariffa TaxID=183260 RepID=A0ABR2TE06_9ROSI
MVNTWSGMGGVEANNVAAIAAMGQEHRMHGFVFAIPPGGLMTRVEEKRSLWISERLVDDSASCRDRKSVELVDPGD